MKKKLFIIIAVVLVIFLIIQGGMMDARTIVTLFLCFVIGLTLSAFITPIFCVIRKVFFVPFIHKRVLNNAITKGHILEARLVKRYSEHASNEEHARIPTGNDIGIYEYEFNGKIYKWRGLSANRLPETIDLYYEKNPQKAVPSDYIGFVERVWPKYYLLFALILTIIVFISKIMNG